MTDENHPPSLPQFKDIEIPADLTVRQALAVLADFARSGSLLEEFQQSFADVFGDREVWEKLSRNDQVAFMEYFLFDRPVKRYGDTPARTFARSALKLPDNLRQKFSSIAGSRVDYYRVARSDEKGVTLELVGGDEIHEISDRLIGGVLAEGEVVLARILKWGEEEHLSAVVNRHKVDDHAEFARRIAEKRKEVDEKTWHDTLAQLPAMIWDNLGSSFAATDAKLEELGPSEHLDRARKILAGGSAAMAVRHARACVEREPGNDEARFVLAVALTRSGNAEEAARILARLVEEKPDELAYRLNKGIADMLRGKPERAKATFEKCLDQSERPEHLSAAYNGLALCAFAEGDTARASKMLKLAAKNATDDPDAMSALVSSLVQTGHFELARTYARKLCSMLDSAEAFAALGDIEMKLRKAKRAAKSYKRALERDPSKLQLARRLGDAMLRAGNDKGAINAFELYLKAYPGDCEAMNSLGVACMRAGKAEESAKWLSSAVAGRPGYVSALCNLGKLMLQLGKLDEAREALTGAIKAEPDNAIAKELYYILEEEELKRKRARDDN
ncbi:MAG: tetratricopeptide repeat protein [Planctomycetota bacterium]|nr:tetratricopeptide repeat protein [Planctomycetota bacterium]